MKGIKIALFWFFCLIFSSTIILPITAAPKTSGVDKQGIRWNYDIESKTLTFTGNGKTAENYNEERGVPDLSAWGEWRKVCKKVIFSEGIIEIGDCYLCDFDRIQEVQLPNTLKIIGKEVFNNCTSLERIELPENLEKIGENAFAFCNLKELNLPKSVKEIGEFAFGSNELREVEWLGTISYGSCVYSGNNISKVTFSEDLRELPAGYMEGCNLKRAVFPKNITKIPASAFGEAKVKEVVLPDTVKKIEDGGFAYAQIEKLILNKGLEYIGDGAFYGAEIDEIIIPDTVKSFGDEVFSFCKAKKIVLPQNIKKIPSSMFADCEKLESIVIPKEVTELNINAFQRCRMLKTMTIQSEKVTKILGNEWDQNPVLRDDITIYVPKKCYESYKKMFEKVVMPKECRILPIEGESKPSNESTVMGRVWIVIGILVVAFFGVLLGRRFTKRK